MSKNDWVTLFRCIPKPWGHEEIFALVDGKYCGKRLHIRAGYALSLQLHEHKDETIGVETGRLSLEIGSSEETLEYFELLPGEVVRIPPTTVHRMAAVTDTVVLEASTTQLDDVIRLDDRYGRDTAARPASARTAGSP